MADKPSVTHRFRCPCGRENKFKAEYGPARKVKVRCGACKQVCRLDVPEKSAEQSARELLEKLGIGGRGLFGGL